MDIRIGGKINVTPALKSYRSKHGYQMILVIRHQGKRIKIELTDDDKNKVQLSDRKELADGLVIVGKNARTINTLIEKIEGVSGKKASIERTYSRPLDVPEIVLDVAKAKNILNWKPKIDINTGLKNTHNISKVTLEIDY